MSDNADWKGRRIGPYEVGERYREIPDDEGRFYAARHLDTGESALVVMPGSGEDWLTPHAQWSTRTTHFTDPPALVVHPEKSDQSSAPTLHELTLGFIRTSGGLASLDARIGTPALFRGEATPPPARRKKTRWSFASAAVVLAVGVSFLLWLRPPEQKKWDQPASKETILFSDRDDAPPVIGYAMPEKPFKEQATPPCIPETETEIRGGCWTQHKLDAPCPRGLAEHEGHCYLPVRKKAPEPRSVSP